MCCAFLRCFKQGGSGWYPVLVLRFVFLAGGLAYLDPERLTKTHQTTNGNDALGNERIKDQNGRMLKQRERQAEANGQRGKENYNEKLEKMLPVPSCFVPIVLFCTLYR